MRRIVQCDHKITIGGPMGPVRTFVTFRKGERITLKKTSKRGEYPYMYRILERGEVGEVSRGVLAPFLIGIGPRPRKRKDGPS